MVRAYARPTRWPTSATRACSCASAAAWRWRRSPWPCAWAAILREHRRQLAYEEAVAAREAPRRRCAARSSLGRRCAAHGRVVGGRGRPVAAPPPRPGAAALAARGRVLFAQACASCHGEDLRGRPRLGPPLRGAGAAAADFYLSTGRMPLADPTDEPDAHRSPPTRAPTSTRSSPSSAPSAGRAIPRVDPARGEPRHRAWRSSPSTAPGCHQIVGARRASSPARPSRALDDTTPTPARRGRPRRALPDAEVLGARSSTSATLDDDRRATCSRIAPSRRPRRLGHRQHRARCPEGMVAWLLAGVVAARGRAADRGAGAVSAELLAPRGRAARRCARRAADARRGGTDPRERDVGADPRAELAVAVLLVLGGGSPSPSPSLIVADPQTQLLGATLGGGAGLPGGRARARRQARRRPARSPSRTAAARTPRGPRTTRRSPRELRRGGDGISRRRAARRRRRGRRRRAGGRAGACPSTALGPGLGDAPDRDAVAARAPARRRPTAAAARRRASRSAASRRALPEGADKRELGSPVVVVRVDPRDARPAARARAAGRRGHPRLLADLHARGLRGDALPLPGRRADLQAARRSSARATTRPSTCARRPSRSSGRPPARCRSCRSPIDARRHARGRRPAVGLGRARRGGACKR